MRMHPPNAFTVAYVAGACALILAMLAFPAIALVAASWVALGLMVKVYGRSVVSPPLIVANGLLVVATAGWFLYPLVVDVPHAAGIRMPADPELLSAGFRALTVASLATSVGALGAALFTRTTRATFREARPLHVKRSTRSLLVAATAAPTVALVSLRGVGSLMERGAYLPEESAGGLGGLLSLAGIVSMVVCGYLLHTQRGPGFVLVVLNVVAFTAVMGATGSRRLAAVPVLLGIGYYVARKDRRATRFLALGVVAALLILPLPLYWRTLDTHGLIPYWESLGGYFGADLGLGVAVKTILISVPLIGATMQSRLPGGALPTALDPRGGETAGWYDIAGRMRLNEFTPTAGVGELAYHGTTTLVVFFLAAGIYLGLLDRHIRGLITRGHQLIAFAHVGLTALFLLYVIQYNLRPSMRMLYYSAALFGAYAAWRYVVRSLLTKPAYVARPQARTADRREFARS